MHIILIQIPIVQGVQIDCHKFQILHSKIAQIIKRIFGFRSGVVSIIALKEIGDFIHVQPNSGILNLII